jgi:hypothetical protein
MRAQALADGGLAARLAAPLVARLRPLLAREYLCEAALLPWLLALQGAGLGAPGPDPGAQGAEPGAREAAGPAAAATPELRLAVQLLSVPAPWPRVRSGPAVAPRGGAGRAPQRSSRAHICSRRLPDTRWSSPESAPDMVAPVYAPHKL